MLCETKSCPSKTNAARYVRTVCLKLLSWPKQDFNLTTCSKQGLCKAG